METREIKEKLANAIKNIDIDEMVLKDMLLKGTSVIDIVKLMPNTEDKQDLEHDAKCLEESIKRYINDLSDYIEAKKTESYPNREYMLQSAEDVGKSIEYLLKTFVWMLF